MRLPRFSAEQALHTGGAYSRSTRRGAAGAVVPAIPFCGNCDEILERCAENGFRPRAVCRACLYGDCYSGTEKPPILLGSQRPLGPWF